MPTNRFRNTIEKIMNNPESYSKNDLYDLFLEMTEKYLNELISTLNYEKAIIVSLGEEEGNKVIEKAATSDSVLNEIGLIDAEENKKEEVIRKLLDYVENKFETQNDLKDNVLPEDIKN